MALFRGYQNLQGSRSNTALVRSGHASPAEKWILDPTFQDKSMSSVFKDGVLFNYQYGGPGMEEIVIPKGRVVGVSAPRKDFVSKKYLTVMTLPGLALGGNNIGMVPYNIAKDWFQYDSFGGNQPSILTQEYVELPYIPSATVATTGGNITYTQAELLAEELALSVGDRNPWGAVIGDVKVGDYVMATASGRLTKWDSSKYGAELIVGQVLAQDLNQEMTGWYKWMLTEEQYKKDDDQFINRSGSSNLPTDEGYPFDPTYAEGNTIFQNYQSKLVTNPTGLMGLHDGSGNYDGFGKNDTEYTDMALETIGAADNITGGSTYSVQAVDFAGGVLKNLAEVTSVKILDGASDVTATYLDPSAMTVSYEKGKINLSFIAAVTKDLTVVATYKAKHYGTPSYLDFKGVQGAMYVLLKK